MLINFDVADLRASRKSLLVTSFIAYWLIIIDSWGCINQMAFLLRIGKDNVNLVLWMLSGLMVFFGLIFVARGGLQEYNDRTKNSRLNHEEEDILAGVKRFLDRTRHFLENKDNPRIKFVKDHTETKNLLRTQVFDKRKKPQWENPTFNSPEGMSNEIRFVLNDILTVATNYDNLIEYDTTTDRGIRFWGTVVDFFESSFPFLFAGSAMACIVLKNIGFAFISNSNCPPFSGT